MNDKLLTISAPVELQAAADQTGPVRCSIVAYGGGMIRPAGMGNTVIDLSGLDTGDNVTLLVDHSATLNGTIGAGVPRIAGSTLSVEGQLSRRTEAVQQMLDLAATGVRFQASVGVELQKVERVNEGDSIDANGQKFKAPRGGLSVVRAGSLREVSVLPLGADASTSVKLAASKQRGKFMSMHQEIEETTALETDRKRCADIATLFAGKFPELQAKAVTKGWDLTKAEIELLEAAQKVERQQEKLAELRAARPKAPSNTHNDGPPEPEVLEASICLSAGLTEEFIGKHYDERTMNAAVSKRRDIGIADALFATIAAAGLHTNKRRVDDETLRLAIQADHMLRATGSSTMSIPNVLANVQNKFLLMGYENVKKVWPTICRITPANDFKPILRIRLLSNGKFEQVGLDGELQNDKLDDQGFTNQVATYGKIITIPRQIIINDDVGALQTRPDATGA